MLNVAILGHGVVGSGVAEMLFKNKHIIKNSVGQEIKLKRVLDILDFEKLQYSEIFTKNFDEILNDDEISIVVETIGGLTPSYEYVKSLLERKKSVVSSNKELVAKKGQELLEIAEKNNVNFLFEASVGGGMPILRPLVNYFTANNILSVLGILNGTTNFILTKMEEENVSFEEALKLAQSLGYAEKNPSDDINGTDCVRKISIICSLILKKHVLSDEILKAGIENISIKDILFAKSNGFVVRLIAKADFFDGENVNVMVFPAMLKNSNKLAFVDGVLNGVIVKTKEIGDVLFLGAGAGKFPTASAVLSDVIEIAKATNKNKNLVLDVADKNTVLDYKKNKNMFYFRFEVKDVEMAKNFIEKHYNSPVFLNRENSSNFELAFTTDYMLEEEVLNLEEKLKFYGIEKKSMFRILC